MEKDYLKYIGQFLGESEEMLPRPTLLRPFIRKDPSIRVFIFDVYGTLLISESGDIDESVFSAEILRRALDGAAIQVADLPGDPILLLNGMLAEFRQAVREFHLIEKSDDRPYPEIDILRMWEVILSRYKEKGELEFTDPMCIRCFTFIFEVLSNNIYPMPGMKEILEILHGKNMPMGIISNAQFYTPVILNYFLHGQVNQSEAVHPFDPDMTVFSYQLMRSKPDPFLFQQVKSTCNSKYDVFPDEILFIGNDMFRDIYPAWQAGFKTALFAGDARSLRLRQDRPELKKVVPDYIITHLGQLQTIVD